MAQVLDKKALIQEALPFWNNCLAHASGLLPEEAYWIGLARERLQSTLCLLLIYLSLIERSELDKVKDHIPKPDFLKLYGGLCKIMSQLTLNLVQGAVSFSFTPEAARTLQTEIAQLLQRLKAIAASASEGGRPQPQKSMEYQYTGDIFLEIFCNPNIYPSPFAAKVLLTIRDERIRLTTEAELTRIIEDIGQYLEQQD